MGLSIILVNYRSTSLLLDCLQSVFAHSSACDFEVIVVDNNSGDNGQGIVLSRFPSVIWIQLERNEGFARANNAGIRKAVGDAVLLLNTDTIVRDHSICEAYFRLLKSNHLACGVQLQNPDGSPQISGNFFMTGSLNNLLPLPYIGAFARDFALRFGAKRTNIPDVIGEAKVDWINGAFLMVKKEAINRVGLLDEEFFLYAEEAEWCFRIGRTGTLCIYGDLHVVHLQGATANQEFGSSGTGYMNLNDRKGLQIMLSNFVRVRKQDGVFWFLFQWAVYQFSVLTYWTFGFIEHLFKPRLVGPFVRQASGFTANMIRLWRFFPAILLRRKSFYKVL